MTENPTFLVVNLCPTDDTILDVGASIGAAYHPLSGKSNAFMEEKSLDKTLNFSPLHARRSCLAGCLKP